MKKLLSAIIIFAFAIALMPTAAQAASVNVTYTYVGRTLMLTGTTPAEQGAQVTVLVTKTGFNSQKPDITKIIGIDQVTAGVNGGFICTMGFGVINDDVEIRVGGTGIDTPTLLTAHLMTTNATVDDVPDNSARIGRDIYAMERVTTGNVADSLKEGGNLMAFKIGGKWYDLLDPRADSSTYLVSKNAISDAVVKSWNLGKWYQQGSGSPITFMK